VRDDVHAGRVQPEEEGLPVSLGLVDELEGEGLDFVVHGFHTLGIERAGVLDLLLADLAPARHHCGVIRIGRPTVNHVARAEGVQQLLRVTGMRGVFHRIEVVEVAEKLVEAMNGREMRVLVTEVLPNWPVA
jgi:hypothetical protein